MFEQVCKQIQQHGFLDYRGTVLKVRRDSVRVWLPEARVGSLCEIHTSSGKRRVEVVGLDAQGHVAMPLDQLSDIRLNDTVALETGNSTVAVGPALLGRVVDSLGVCYDTGLPVDSQVRMPLYLETSNPMKRELIQKPLDLGIRSINGFLTCGVGQRQGIFAGSGVGKSVLLGMMARFTSADVVVICLVGERGREVREFVQRELGTQGLKKSVLVVETSDRSAVRRVRAGFYSAAICEYFRSQGKQVLWMMDSITRFAMAQREIGIAAGEPPTSKGYTPSVFSNVARLVERAGNWGQAGAITGLFTVLVEGDDLEDPVSDSVRSMLDGHIVLSRRLANRGQYPAVDILSSVSRVMDTIVSEEHRKKAKELRATVARYQENEDAIQYGMYLRGSDPSLDACIDLESKVRDFLMQDKEAPSSFGESKNTLLDLV